MNASYELMYWTRRPSAPGGLIDTTVNPNLIPPGGAGGPLRPQAQFDTSSLLAQGFGFEISHEFLGRLCSLPDAPVKRRR